jgi:peptide/nickel transport system substrate-binding protein
MAGVARIGMAMKSDRNVPEGGHVSRSLKAGFAALVLVLASLGIAACGDEDGGGGEGRTGGIIRVAHVTFPDFLDPALSYTVDGWQALLQVYPGLLTFPHESGPAGAEPVPGLAEDMPEISADGRTYRFKLRDNLRFSDGTPIRASDFKASIERVLAQDSQGSGFYVHIEGGEEFIETKRGGIDGIEVDDQTRDVTITLTEPRGSFTYELAIPFAGVVPKDTPDENQTREPPPGAGRYVIQDVEVNRSYSLRKNPNFSESLEGTAVDAGKADGFDATVIRSESTQVTRIIQNDLDFMVENPPADRVGELKAQYEGERFRQFSTPSIFYFFLNASVPPFDDQRVRQAANHAIDPDAINRIQGGTIEPANETLPKGIPGYRDWPDLYPHDVNRARQLVRTAGAEGEQVTVWGDDVPTTRRTMEYYAEVLNDIGLDAEVRIIPGETYFQTIGDRSTRAQTGFSNWIQDYPHPANFIDVVLNPDNVVATGNNNWSYNADDRQLARKITAAAAEPELTDEVEDQWAQIDREIQEKAYWAVYGTRKQTTFFSERMDFETCKGDDWLPGTHDWAQFCLK